jgi:hypothetical protein
LPLLKSSIHSNGKCIQEVDKWEKDSIYKIKQTADQCKPSLITYNNKSIIDLENKLHHIAKQLKEIR